jgi:hypothetical protein
MASLDRPAIVELLGRLGEENEQTVVQAARELHAKVAQSGLTWDDLLRTESEIGGTDEDHHEVAPDAMSDAEPSAGTPGDLSAADKAEAARIIDRLLARKNLSSTLREDLTDLKSTIVDGTFDASDSRYIRALAKRLGA